MPNTTAPKCVQDLRITSNLSVSRYNGIPNLIITTMKKSIIALIALALCACNPDTWNLDAIGMFSGSSPDADQRFHDSEQYNKEHGHPVIKAQAEQYNV